MNGSPKQCTTNKTLTMHPDCHLIWNRRLKRVQQGAGAQLCLLHWKGLCRKQMVQLCFQQKWKRRMWTMYPWSILCPRWAGAQKFLHYKLLTVQALPFELSCWNRLCFWTIPPGRWRWRQAVLYRSICLVIRWKMSGNVASMTEIPEIVFPKFFKSHARATGLGCQSMATGWKAHCWLNESATAATHCCTAVQECIGEWLLRGKLASVRLFQNGGKRFIPNFGNNCTGGLASIKDLLCTSSEEYRTILYFINIWTGERHRWKHRFMQSQHSTPREQDTWTLVKQSASRSSRRTRLFCSRDAGDR